MGKNIYVKPKILIISAFQEADILSVSGEVDGYVKITNGGDADDGMEAQARKHGSYSLWDE